MGEPGAGAGDDPFPAAVDDRVRSTLEAGAAGELRAQTSGLHAARLAQYAQTKAGLEAGKPDPYVTATLGFGLIYERAVLSWFDQLPDQIRGTAEWEEARVHQTAVERKPRRRP